MLYSLGFALPLLMLPLGGLAKETVHGAVIFSRHGDRTAKIFPPTKLTAVGQNQLYDSGAFYRNRYIEINSTTRVAGISYREVVSSQLHATAPDQDLLVTSGQAFLQGLYPPFNGFSTEGTTQILADGSRAAPPLNGYQYAYVHTVPETDPATIWLKGDDNCPAYIRASAGYYGTEQFTRLYVTTKQLYESFSDILDGIYSRDGMNYINAYSIFDYINVGMIHNKTIADRVSADELLQLRTLADSLQWGFNGNTAPALTLGPQTISGRTLASKVLTQLSSIIDSNGKKNLLSLFVGSYDTFLSFFAISQLPGISGNFRGLPGYASTMTFELISYSGVNGEFPSDSKDLWVRFLFRNGTDTLRGYPLFGNGRANAVMSWVEFRDSMARISVSSMNHWCTVCDSTEGFCADDSSSSSSSTSSGSTTAAQASHKSRSLSPAVAGVVGAIAALAAIGALMALAMFVFGMRFSRSRKQTSENGFKGGEKLESEAGSARNSMDNGVHYPDKVYTQ